MTNGARRWGSRGWLAAGRGLIVFGWSLLAVLLVAALAVAVSSVVWMFLVPEALLVVRGLAGRARGLAGRWSGVPVPSLYQPRPPAERGASGWWQRARWVLADPATWRDVRWLLVAPVVGLLAVLPAALIAYGVFGVLQPVLWRPLAAAGGVGWYGAIPVAGPATAWLAAFCGAITVQIGLGIGPWAVSAHARLTRALLAPPADASLARRVRHLTATRAEALDAQAAELRRIERDLHDGAQARLVALGMTLAAAEHLLADNPPARALVVEARQASADALDELRDLVRGIHPPVLADRGLGDAVRALAMDSRLPVDLAIDLPDRLAPAVESAAYFAISELLANAAKHSGARRVRFDIHHRDDVLHVTAVDDGHGGARIDAGTGLRGVQQRLAPFDGRLALTSPPGGPTTVTLELPCGSSSPKTTPSFETE